MFNKLEGLAHRIIAEFIMPKKPLNLLKGILLGSDDDVTIEYNDSNAKFSFENSILICRLIDGKYPNYEAVIPKENPNHLTIGRNQFLNSVRRVSIFSNKTTHQIRLKIAGAELNISAEDIDYSNKAEERLTCDYQGDDMQIGFNSRFLSEMLSNLNADDVQLEMSMPNRAAFLFAQLEQLKEIQDKRKLLWKTYYNGLIELENNNKLKLALTRSRLLRTSCFL